MRDARDAEDKRLLEKGEIDLLLAGWYETILGRCIARMRGPMGEDVAHAVCERLWRELKAGRYRDGTLPFRVIVHKVIGWGEGESNQDSRPPPPLDRAPSRGGALEICRLSGLLPAELASAARPGPPGANPLVVHAAATSAR